jgi:predicted transcriptional regulator
VIEDALRGYIASEKQVLEAVDEGLRDLEADDVVDHIEIVEMMRERRRRFLARSQ